MNAQDISRGQRAKTILESDIFKECHEKVQQSIFDAFAECDPADVEQLQTLRLKLAALAEIVRNMVAVMNTGKIAEAEAARERSLSERIADRFKRST